MAEPDSNPNLNPNSPPGAIQRFERFVTTYSTFLSSFVVGAAGLVATSVYQSNQQEIVRSQGDRQIELSKISSDNQWKITRAEILSKNLQVLSGTADETADERYGLLLSLSRGNMIDPELATLYALELGQHNPDYMVSVLQSFVEKPRKVYEQLAHNYLVSCTRRYGTSQPTAACKDDRNAERSDAIAQYISTELAAGNRLPIELVNNEKEVQEKLVTYVRLFEPYLGGLYDRRQIGGVESFEHASTGARLVTSLTLLEESVEINEPTDERQRWLTPRLAWLEEYALGKSCDSECRGKIADVLLTDIVPDAASGEKLLKVLLGRPRAEASGPWNHLHARLLWCQADSVSTERLRDDVLVPLIANATANVKSGVTAPVVGTANGTTREVGTTPQHILDLLELLALAPEPLTGIPPRAAWDSLMATLRDVPDAARYYQSQRQSAIAQRKSKQSRNKYINFCEAESPVKAP